MRACRLVRSLQNEIDTAERQHMFDFDLEVGAAIAVGIAFDKYDAIGANEV